MSRARLAPRRHRSAGVTRSVLAVVLSPAVLLVALGWFAAPTASAHAFLVSSTPTEGATLTEVPRDVTLTFSGDLEPGAQVTVMGPDGAPLHSGESSVSAATVSQRLSDQSGGVPGLYTIAYTVMSVDGHEIAGQLGFYIGGAEAGGTGAEPAAAASLGPAGRSSEPGSSGPGLMWTILLGVVLLAAAATLWVLHRRRSGTVPVRTDRSVSPRARNRAEATSGRSRDRR